MRNFDVLANFAAVLAPIAGEEDDLENPVDGDFHPETALNAVYRGLDHPA